ncbi:hypothetical protein N9A93_06490 [Akkermansiaceae bacterium]|nr:hypothetical protein [Akkermansiaceae bacterium]
MTKQFDRYPGYAGRFLKSRFARGFNTQQAEGEISVLSTRTGPTAFGTLVVADRSTTGVSAA